jgi:hypothetical protein
MLRNSELNILNCLTGFKRQVVSSPFGFNLLSKEDASLFSSPFGFNLLSKEDASL